MFFDCHVHSHASPDSQMHPADAIDVCQKMGLGLIFTEHMDYVFPRDGIDPNAPDKPVEGKDFLPDFSLYPIEYEKYRSTHVLLGLEIGLTAYGLFLNRQAAQGYEYDFILGAIHFVDGYDLFNDATNVFDYDRKRRMLTYSLEMVRISDFIDAFGHIDYISRYTPMPDKNVYYDDYIAEYDALLIALAKRDIALEINTSRLGQIPGLDKNMVRVLKRYKELGGRYVTIGSDAHEVSALGRSREAALAMTREADLIPVYFKKRKLIYCNPW